MRQNGAAPKEPLAPAVVTQIFRGWCKAEVEAYIKVAGPKAALVANVGPNDGIVLPPGWVFSEINASRTAHGLKMTMMYHGALAEFKKCIDYNTARSKPVKLMQEIYDVFVRIPPAANPRLIAVDSGLTAGSSGSGGAAPGENQGLHQGQLKALPRDQAVREAAVEDQAMEEGDSAKSKAPAEIAAEPEPVLSMLDSEKGDAPEHFEPFTITFKNEVELQAYYNKVGVDNFENKILPDLHERSKTWPCPEATEFPVTSAKIRVGEVWLCSPTDMSEGRAPVGSRDEEYWGMVLDHHSDDGTFKVVDLEQAEIPESAVAANRFIGRCDADLIISQQGA